MTTALPVNQGTAVSYIMSITDYIYQNRQKKFSAEQREKDYRKKKN